MVTEGFPVALAVYAAAIGWVSMAMFGVNRRFLDQHSRSWFGLHRLVSAIGGVAGAWVFVQLPPEKSAFSLTLASILGGFITSDLYNIVTGSVPPSPWWTPRPWQIERPSSLDVFNDREDFTERAGRRNRLQVGDQPDLPSEREQPDKPLDR